MASVASLAPAAALATGHPGSPTSTFLAAYLDSDRCRVLAVQVGHIKATRQLDGNVAGRAAEGLQLCGSGNFAAGADRLREAVRMMGETPVEPKPITRLH